MAAAAARASQLESIADNLANTQSPGFKASRPAFQSFMSAEQGSDKILSAAVATGIDLSPGVTVPTDRQLDVALPDDTFLAVRTPAGTAAYTRNGHIEVGPEGGLTIAGNLLLDIEGRPMTIPEGANARVVENGELVADDEVLGQLGLVEIKGPLARSGPALFTPGAGAAITPLAETTVRVGALEMGNASALEATVQMIAAQRHFDTAMQAIQTYRKLDERAIEVGRVR